MKRRGAIVGFGGQGKRYFLAMKQLHIQVAAICDINPESLRSKPPSEVKAWQTPYPSRVDLGDKPPNFYTDWREMLRKEKPLDVVGVVTWTQDHAPVTIEAAESGVKAIVCEKPISNSLESARKMIEICRANRTTLVIGHTRRWWPEHQRVKELISKGVIGDLRHLWVSCGGARLGDLAVHFIDWMRWINNDEIHKVTGWVEEIDEPNPRGHQFWDPPGALMLIFSKGVRGYIDLSRNVAMPGRWEVVGTKGRILIEEFHGKYDRWEIDIRPEKTTLTGTLDYYGKLERQEFIKTGSIDWVGMIVDPLREAIQGQTTCGGQEGYKALEALIATHISHENGNVPIQLPLSDPKTLSRVLTIA